MKFKLDENFGKRGADVLRAAGCDVTTVAEQVMCSTPDDDLIQACGRERRVLVTMDTDFGNPLRYRPAGYSGIALVRLPHKSRPDDLYAALITLITEISDESIDGRLWIVQPGRIRVYRPGDE